MRRAIDHLWPYLFVLSVLVVWQVSCDVFKIPQFLLPTPLAILDKIVTLHARLAIHILATLREIVGGFVIAVVGGTILAVLTSQSRILARSLLPILVTSQAIPTIATAPILVVWLGPTDAARLAVVFLIAFFPIVVNTATGLISADQQLVDLVTGLNGSRWKMLVKVRLPNALPYLFTGMRISVVLSVIGAVVGEFVASTRGLGYLIFTGAANLETPLVFAAVAILAVIGNVLYRSVIGLQWLIMPWSRSADRLQI